VLADAHSRDGREHALASTSTGATNNAIWAALPNAIATLESRRFLRAPAKVDAISAAAPTSATAMNPTNARRHAEGGR
jgi:hypothetical protein